MCAIIFFQFRRKWSPNVKCKQGDLRRKSIYIYTYYIYIYTFIHIHITLIVCSGSHLVGCWQAPVLGNTVSSAICTTSELISELFLLGGRSLTPLDAETNLAHMGEWLPNEFCQLYVCKVVVFLVYYLNHQASATNSTTRAGH